MSRQSLASLAEEDQPASTPTPSTVRASTQPPPSGFHDLGSLSDAELVYRVLGDSDAAAKLLYQRHRRLANGLAFRLLGSDADLDDVVQDAFLQAFRRLERLEQPQAFASWLASIVVRTAQRRLSRRILLQRLGLRRPEMPDLDTFLAAEAPPDVATHLKQVYAVLDQLPVQERTALVLRRIEGYTMGQVAELMGVSLTTAKRRLAAAEVTLEKLK